MLIRSLDKLKQVLGNSHPKIVLWNQATPSEHPSRTRMANMYIREYTTPFENEYYFEFPESEFFIDATICHAFAFNLKDLWSHGFVLEDCFELGYYYDEPDPHPISNFYLNRIGSDRLLNTIIPIQNHVDAWSRFDFNIKEHRSLMSVDERNMLWDDYAPRLFSLIELEGLSVNEDLFRKYFNGKSEIIKNSTVKTHYNFFTKTGRPSNAFGGVNFAALKKDNGERTAFVSKYGKFVNIDFQAYHIHLLINHLGIQMIGDPHTYFAQEYYRNKSNWNLPISKEEYESGKQKTFKNLYGSLDHDVKYIPFFTDVKNFGRTQVYNRYLRDGVLHSPCGRAFQYDEELTENKAFNYYVQMLETEQNIRHLQNISQSGIPMPCLYTYDSFVFDVAEDRVDDLVNSLKHVLRYPHTVEIGDTLDF